MGISSPLWLGPESHPGIPVKSLGPAPLIENVENANCAYPIQLRQQVTSALGGST